ncbi:MAG: hypothetical protein NWQ13_10500, partial [Glaciimonas sp.]|nr:hypothetical protein [Glaciimonas sp.]
MQKIIALNVDTTATATLAQDSAAQMQRVTNYSRQLIHIATNTHAEINTTAAAHITQRKQQTLDITERVTRIAPPGSTEAMNNVKAVLENMTTGYEHVTHSVKQVADMG